MIKLKSIKKVYVTEEKKTNALKGVSIDMRKAEFVCILGPSGCGKTTTLRMIAGFNSIEGGDFYFNDKRINDMDPAKRNIGMVFQNYAIFPHLSVKDNVAKLRGKRGYILFEEFGSFPNLIDIYNNVFALLINATLLYISSGE